MSHRNLYSCLCHKQWWDFGPIKPRLHLIVQDYFIPLLSIELNPHHLRRDWWSEMITKAYNDNCEIEANETYWHLFVHRNVPQRAHPQVQLEIHRRFRSIYDNQQKKWKIWRRTIGARRRSAVAWSNIERTPTTCFHFSSTAISLYVNNTFTFYQQHFHFSSITLSLFINSTFTFHQQYFPSTALSLFINYEPSLSSFSATYAHSEEVECRFQRNNRVQILWVSLATPLPPN